MRIKYLLFFVIFSFNLHYAQAQALGRKEVNDTIKNMPSFSMYNNNYFITGIPTNKNISKNTADIKYQISFKQLITRNTLPLNMYLYLTYTQTAFWNAYAKSSPFHEINFNPGIGLGKPLFNKNDKLAGLAFLKLEHESNGRDSIYSRSWNRVSLAFHTSLNKKFTVGLKAWLPFQYKEDNPDLLDYVGLGEIDLSYTIEPDKFIFDVMLRKGLDAWKGSVRSRLYYKPWKSTQQYLMLEWFAGYAESLVSYQHFRSMVRIGYVVKSDELNFLRPLLQKH